MSDSAELTRVSNKIKTLIIEFLTMVGESNRFHMQDLQEYVSKNISIAPDSPSRVLRNLKSKKVIKYRLISRANSLYEFCGF